MRATKGLLLALGLLAIGALPSAAQQTAEEITMKSMPWRSIGPANMGGRVSDIVGIPGDTKTFYVATPDAGIWKTTNGGTTFEGIFQNESVYSIGAIALAPSDPNVIWVGTGEGDPRNSVSYGNGVYRSTDAGKTWTHLGLDDTERIHRIVVDTRYPYRALVCAMGHEWGPNEERGVFRTTDAGQTWTKVLYLDQDTGCSDISMDLNNPRIVYAGMWTFRRKPWHFTDGGGETALYKSTDGGITWEKKTEGLPRGDMARIGVGVAQSSPNTVYLITESVSEGSVFRSEDYGETWRMVNDDKNVNFRPFYYSTVRVDPNQPDVLYSLSGGLSKSTDGGRTFQRIAGGVHGDHQAMWINPGDSDHILSGSDGGYQISFDEGATWDIINNVVLSQFYQIFFDDRDPYYVCGGLQDNGNWCGPSRTNDNVGILKDDWYTVSGGDGFYTVPIPGQPNLVYSNSQGGPITLTDINSGMSKRIHPSPNRTGSAGDDMKDHEYRFNWDAPIHISPHDPGTVYYAGNVLFKSTNYGYTWEVISPDLTQNEKHKQGDSGGPIYIDNTAAEFHSTILTIAESPVEAGVIWVGTDDGNIQVTRDGGRTWTNVKDNVAGLPAETWIAKIDASWHDAGTAYVAVDNHRLDDFTPHAYVTRDYGERWEDVSVGLPRDDYVKVIREDPKNPNLLYLGMDRGIFASWNSGESWTSIQGPDLGPVSVRDIKIHPRENDLIIGTHGRGAFIVDDITPTQNLQTAIAAGTHFFQPRRATLWAMWGRKASMGQRTFRAENPPNGALLFYYLGEEPAGPVTFTITDGSGGPVRTLTERNATVGINRMVWDLRHEAAPPVRGQAPGGGGFRRGGGGGPAAVPGRYQVTMSVGGAEQSRTLEVRGDPNIDPAFVDYQTQFETAMALRALQARVNEVMGNTTSVLEQLRSLVGVLVDSDDVSVEGVMETTKEAIEELARWDSTTMRAPPPRMGYRQYPRLSDEVRSLYGSVSGAQSKPTDGEIARMAELEDEVADAEEWYRSFVDNRVGAINRALRDQPKIVTRRE